MAIEQERDKLLLRLMHLIAEKFKDAAVLKGGMYLRLLHSPRWTQDVDYVFVTRESRKIIAAELKEMLERENISIRNMQLNSRGIVTRIESDGVTVTLEISVTEKLNRQPDRLTTEVLAVQYEMGPRVITVMSAEEAYANKIAACLERKVIRDLYDITILQPQTAVNAELLKIRFDRLQINRAKPIALNFKEAAGLLRKRAESLTQEDLERELSGVVLDSFMTGGLLIIKNSLNRLCQELEYLK